MRAQSSGPNVSHSLSKFLTFEFEPISGSNRPISCGANISGNELRIAPPKRNASATKISSLCENEKNRVKIVAQKCNFCEMVNCRICKSSAIRFLGVCTRDPYYGMNISRCNF